MYKKYHKVSQKKIGEINMKNLELADVAETFLGNKSRIKSTKFAKGICEYIVFWFCLDFCGISNVLKKTELRKIWQNTAFVSNLNLDAVRMGEITGQRKPAFWNFLHIVECFNRLRLSSSYNYSWLLISRVLRGPRKKIVMSRVQLIEKFVLKLKTRRNFLKKLLYYFGN